MVHFVGAGSGAPDLITLRGDRLLRAADVVIYAGSLVNPALLDVVKPGCAIHDSAKLTLEEVIALIKQAEAQGKTTVRLHTGDPSLFGAIREQIDALDALNIAWTIVPGVSSFVASAASLGAEYTLPGVSQSVILTRMEGRTPVPAGEDIAALAAHGCSMAIFLSAGMTQALQQELLKGAYSESTPAAIVYKASWPEERVLRCTVGTLHQTAQEHNITKTALILVGDFLGNEYQRSLLYHPDFTTGYRQGTEGQK